MTPASFNCLKNPASSITSPSQLRKTTSLSLRLVYEETSTPLIKSSLKPLIFSTLIPASITIDEDIKLFFASFKAFLAEVKSCKVADPLARTTDAFLSTSCKSAQPSGL